MSGEKWGKVERGLMQVNDRNHPRKKAHVQYTKSLPFSTANDLNTFSKPTPSRHRVDTLLDSLPKQETLKSLNVTCCKRGGWVRDFVSDLIFFRCFYIILPTVHRTRTNYKSIPHPARAPRALLLLYVFLKKQKQQ